MPDPMALARPCKGGEWLLEAAGQGTVFTPERLNPEHPDPF